MYLWFSFSIRSTSCAFGVPSACWPLPATMPHDDARAPPPVNRPRSRTLLGALLCLSLSSCGGGGFFASAQQLAFQPIVVEMSAKTSLKVGVVLHVSQEAQSLLKNEITQRDYVKQPQDYFTWASYSSLKLDTSITVVQGPSEKDASGACKPMAEPNYATVGQGFDASAFDVTVWMNYNAECSGSCSAVLGRVTCAKLATHTECTESSLD